MSLTHQCLHTRLSPTELFSCKYINQRKLEFFRVSFLIEHNVRIHLLHHDFVCNIIFCCVKYKMHDRNVWIIIVIIAINKCSVIYAPRFNKWMKRFECALMCVCVYLREFFSIFIILKMSFTLTQLWLLPHKLQPYYHIRSHRENNSCKEEKKGKHLPFYHHHVVFFSFYLFIHSIHFMMMMIMIIHESVTIYIQLHF